MSHWPQAKRMQFLKPTAVNRVLQEVRDVQREGRTVVSLMRGQPDSPTPPHIVAAAHQAMLDGFARVTLSEASLIGLQPPIHRRVRRHRVASAQRLLASGSPWAALRSVRCLASTPATSGYCCIGDALCCGGLLELHYAATEATMTGT